MKGKCICILFSKDGYGYRILYNTIYIVYMDLYYWVQLLMLLDANPIVA